MNFESYFKELQDKGINLSDEQKKWYIKKASILGEDVKREYPSTPDEAFEVNTAGLYYAIPISIARYQNRIRNIPFDRTVKVHTAWDLGFRDATCILFFQIMGREIHLIDFVEKTGTSIAEFAKILHSKEYVYGSHLAPHDIKVHELSSGVSRFDTAAKLGIPFSLVPDLSIADGIDMVRNMFPRLYFHNSQPVLDMVRHIENYSQKWDRTVGQWSGRPDHSPHSHCADALRYLCVGLDHCTDESQGVSQEKADALWRTHGRRV